MSPLKIEFPAAFQFLFKPSRYKSAYGGRGSGKSTSFARALALMASARPLRVLCCREIQNTIRDSVHKLICDQIAALKLDSWFTVTDRSIRSSVGSEFIFKGLRYDPQGIKSTEGVDICWVEEAQTVSEESWAILIPTIRKAGSEIWLSWNPMSEESPTYRRFIKNPPPDCICAEVNYDSNPWFPDVLRREMEHLKASDYPAYEHIWLGKPLTQSAAVIFAGKYEARDFTPAANWNGPYQGMDFGFSIDPTAAIRCWIHDGCLWIECEAVKVSLELDQTAEYIAARIPRFSQYVTRADSARPESISYLKRHGMPRITAAEKGKGSVEDGISFIKSFNRVYIHNRCVETLKEFRSYSYKVDRLSGDILPDVQDAFNHCIDAIRYALEPVMKNRRPLNIRI